MTSETLWERHHQAQYLAKLGFLYHRKRERFFDLCDKWTKVLTVLLGASLLAALIKDVAPYIGAAVSAVGLLSLVFGYTDRKQKHKELAEAYAEVQAEIDSAGEHYDAAQLSGWLAQLQRLNTKEPPTLGTLVVICQNEIAVAEGKLASVVPVPGYKRWFASWHDFHTAT